MMRAMAKDKNGRPLPLNTYHHSKGYYIYKRPDGGRRTIRDENGDPAGYELACSLSERANQLRSLNTTQSIKSIQHWVNEYVRWSEGNYPKLIKKDSWRYRKSELNKYADHFSHINIDQLSLADLRPWWDSLSYDMQHNRQSAFNKFHQYAIAHEACKLNPFTNADYLPRLMKKAKPEKLRSPLELDQFFTIYNCEAIEKYPHVKIAMVIAITTGLREADICSLTFNDHVIDNRLCTSIGKSLGQRGAAAAAHHGYDLSQHTLLRTAIKLSRELSLKHRRCPFLLSYHQRGHREQIGNKQHISQVMPKKLSKDFAAVRDTCDLTWPKAAPGTFHEIRGLWIKQAMNCYSEEVVQNAAAHLNVSTTRGYIADHQPVFKDIPVVITEAMLGGML